MKELIFVTGNPKKAHYASQLTGMNMRCEKIDLPEVQSLDSCEIVRGKLHAAYQILRRPCFVEDISLQFEVLGRLPGPFIKFFVSEIGSEGCCRLLDGKSRNATARCIIGYKDGEREEYFEGVLNGKIAMNPAQGAEGFGKFGWSDIFIPDGCDGPMCTFSAEQFAEYFLKLRRYDLLKKVVDKRTPSC